MPRLRRGHWRLTPNVGAKGDELKKILKILGVACLYLGVIPILALVTTYLSARIVVGHDHTEEATVGIITFRGFPVWFIEEAPGISIMSSWHFDRFQMNFGAWLAILLLTAAATHIMIRRRIVKGSNGRRDD